MKFSIAIASTLLVLGVSHTRLAATPQAPRTVSFAPKPAPAPVTLPEVRSEPKPTEEVGEPLTVLTRSAYWFNYPKGCEGIKDHLDLVVHFHGAHTTVIPEFIKSKLDALLLIVNKGIGSGPYSRAFGVRSQVEDLLSYVRRSVAKQCHRSEPTISRLALSSWSAGYGATEQILRLAPELVDAVLLSDGLHVGFTDPEQRTVDEERLDVFIAFAKRASLGQRLMSITHSAILPQNYAASGETALVLSRAVGAPVWPAPAIVHGMQQLTAARRGQFFVTGYAGNDKAAHSQQLYAIGDTSFARLRDYWSR